MILENIYESEFVSIEINSEENILIITWLENTTNILDSQYRAEILNLVSCIEKYRSRFVLDDARLYSVGIPTETQEWVEPTVYETFQVLEKYAMVMPAEFFANLSADLNIEEL